MEPGTSFPTFGEALDFIDSLPAKDKYAEHTALMETLMRLNNRSEELIDCLWERVQTSGSWKNSVSDKQFQASWREVREISKPSRGKATTPC